MAYEVIWHEKVLKDLKALSRQDSARIIAKVKTHLVEDPVGLGKPLSGVFKGLMRYRVGSHRVIYAVDHENRRISVLHVKPRDAAYRRRARADVYMKQKTHTGSFTMMGQTQPAKDEIMVFWLGENKARTDQETGNTSSILLGEKKILYMIDHNKKQYSEMPLDFDKMFDEAAEAGAGEDPEMAEAKKKMPGFMKGLMKGVMGGMSAKVTETGETKKIDSWDCRKYLVEMDMGMGKSQSEAWATEDLKIDYGLYFASANAMLASQPGFDKIVKEMQKVKGVIVYQTSTVKMMGSDVTSTTELLECSDKTAPAGNYDIPAGYKKVKSMGK